MAGIQIERPGLKGADRSCRWALCIEMHGVAVSVHASSPEMLDRIAALLPPEWRTVEPDNARRDWWIVEKHDSNGQAAFRVGRECKTITRSHDIDDAVDALEGCISLYVAEHASPAVFVHAGVVGWRGGAIVMPGLTLSGKTTLVEAFLAAGATYYSDEFAIIGADGLVYPYARPLSLRSREGCRPQRKTAESMGSRSGSGPIPVHTIVAARYCPGRTWSPTRLSAGETVLELFANTVSARRQPVEALALLERAACGAVGLKGARGEARQAVEMILDPDSGGRSWRGRPAFNSSRPATAGVPQGARQNVPTGSHGGTGNPSVARRGARL